MRGNFCPKCMKAATTVHTHDSLECPTPDCKLRCAWCATNTVKVRVLPLLDEDGEPQPLAFQWLGRTGKIEL